MSISGKQLLDARLLRGLTRAQVADQLGVHEKTISNWERSEVPPRQEQLVRVRFFSDSLAHVPDVALAAELLRRLAERHRSPQHSEGITPDWLDVDLPGDEPSSSQPATSSSEPPGTAD